MLEEEVNSAVRAIEPQAVESYWTPDKIANARPMPTPLVLIYQSSLSNRTSIEEVGEESTKPAGYISGCTPRNNDCNQKKRLLSSQGSQDEFFSRISALGNIIPIHGSKPDNPKNGPYLWSIPEMERGYTPYNFP